jgi:hypothetical protein
MESLRENKYLCYGLFGLDAFLFILATDTIQPLNEFMQLAPLPSVEVIDSLSASYLCIWRRRSKFSDLQ